MNCPVCGTFQKLCEDRAISSSALPRCSQCDSDLEVFGMLEALKVGKKEKPKKPETMESSGLSVESVERRKTKIFWPLFCLASLFISLLLYFIFNFQISLFEELTRERQSRSQAEERNIKITEQLIEKTSNSYLESLQTLTQFNKEQRESIQKLNEKIYEMEKNNALKEQLVNLKNNVKRKKNYKE